MKSLIHTLFLLTVLSICAGCSSENDKVIIIKFVTHPALDELEEGFIERLNDNMKNYPNLNNIIIVLYNANASPQLAKELAEISSSQTNTKLILAIATPVAQAVSRTPSSIPFIYGAVSDPLGAGIIPSERGTGIQNVGYNIIKKAIYFIVQTFPDLKTIGTIYNPAEQNSVFVQGLISRACKEYGINLIQTTIRDGTEISSMTEELASRVDVIYSANDNTVNASINSLVSVCDALNIPLILGDLSTLSKGAFASIGLEYKSMGYDLADIAIQILNGESINNFPPLSPPEPSIWINKNKMELLNIMLPETVTKIVTAFK